MKGWLIYLFVMWALWYMIDVQSESVLKNVVFPVVLIVLSIILLGKVLDKLGLFKTVGSRGSGSSGGYYGGGGDSGGSSDGGGCD